MGGHLGSRFVTLVIISTPPPGGAGYFAGLDTVAALHCGPV